MRIKARLFSSFQKAYWRTTYDGYRNRYDIDPSFNFRDSVQVTLGGEGEIHLGAHGHISNFVIIRADGGTKVHVGEGCVIADRVRIITWEQLVDQPHVATWYKPKFKKGNVIIGNDCWLCTGAIITPNVTIGDRVVIGANAVVTHDMPSETLCGGVPARVIRKRRLS